MSSDHWVGDANCKGKPTIVFFPNLDRTNLSSRWLLAREICADCKVTEQCLSLVMGLEYTDDKWGMFGGLTPDERQQLREKREKVFNGCI